MNEYFSKIYRGSQEEFFSEIDTCMSEEKKMFVVTANPETLMIGQDNQAFHSILVKEGTTIVPDGIGVVKAANTLGIPLTQRITGVDLVTFLFEEADKKKKSLFLYGAKPEVMETLVGKLHREYPGMHICGYHDGYSGDGDEILGEAVRLKPDIVLVALGIPKQELLIDRHFADAEKGIFVGVGGSFDVISGTKKRAPHFFVKHNLEWLYRIVKEPKRIKRFYHSNVRFLWKVRRMKKEKKYNG
ncbi:MAG TPA: WecB/TagA/CpsF family glycosyltransferase [Firmicutes bacterium]|nr:WecB/TagA/CpsF family glycosyltransferase [Bacillota bacterium]